MVSLADLRARNVIPIWQEAVAVVQELLHTVVATHGSADQLPDLEHVALIANGDVVALPGSPVPEHPVRHLAVLLQLLLEDVVAPPELRAFIDANIADPPKYDTVEEFSIQLAFFERPGRRSDVERLVGRAMSSDAQTRAEEELRRLKVRAIEAAEAGTHKPDADEPTPRQYPSRQIAVAVAVALVGALIAGGWWLVSSRSGATRAAGRPPAAVQKQAEPAAATPSAASAGTTPQAVGTASATAIAGDTTPAAASSGTAPAPESASLIERTKSTLARAVQFAINAVSGSSAEPAKADPAANEAPAEARAPARTRRAASRRTKPEPAAPVIRSITPEPPQVATITSELDEGESPISVGTLELQSVVYSVADGNVMPAILVRPVLPATPPPDVLPSQIGTLELVVDENGDVERVRLVSPSNRFHERMLVAHAKTWKFRPAIKDGRPVKFRTRVRLTI